MLFSTGPPRVKQGPRSSPSRRCFAEVWRHPCHSPEDICVLQKPPEDGVLTANAILLSPKGDMNSRLAGGAPLDRSSRFDAPLAVQVIWTATWTWCLSCASSWNSLSSRKMTSTRFRGRTGFFVAALTEPPRAPRLCAQRRCSDWAEDAGRGLALCGQRRSRAAASA